MKPLAAETAFLFLVPCSLLPRLFPALFADLDGEAFDLLVEGRERNAELLGSLSLVAVAALELFDDDAALDVFEDVEERGVGVVFEQCVLEAAPGDVAGQEIRANDRARGKHDAAFY